MRKAIVHIIENESQKYHKLNVEFDEIDELIFSIDNYSDEIEVWNLLIFVSCKYLTKKEIFKLENVHVKISSDVYIPKNIFTNKEEKNIYNETDLFNSMVYGAERVSYNEDLDKAFKKFKKSIDKKKHQEFHK